VFSDNWREDPKVAIIAAVVVVLGIGVAFWLGSGPAETPGLYTCDTCGTDFGAVPSDGLRPKCPKGDGTGVTPFYHKCPNCNEVFDAYQTRPTESAMKREPGSPFEHRIPGRTNWIPQMLVSPQGTQKPNPDWIKYMKPEAWICPKCKFSAATNRDPNKFFKASPKPVPQ